MNNTEQLRLRWVNKVHFFVKKSINKWFEFRRWDRSIQLTGDTRMGWSHLKQYAERLWKTHFMRDFTDILEAIDADNNRLREQKRFTEAK
jgi:hypothetical protein